MEPDTNDHPSSPTWRTSEPTGLAMYREGKSLGTVWHDEDKNTWAGSVYVGIRQAMMHGFVSKKDAQDWCEEQIARWQLKEREAGA